MWKVVLGKSFTLRRICSIGQCFGDGRKASTDHEPQEELVCIKVQASAYGPTRPYKQSKTRRGVNV